VELIRSLYGTVIGEKATHGILATTSYFSREAGEFARRVKYQLSLRDYNDLRSWFEEYMASQRRLIL
jgi:restriction endonuclease Mrr